MKSVIYKKIFTILISVILTLTIIEIYLRLVVIKPWKNLKIEDPLINKSN